jgi:hypothetical protein
VGRSLWYHNFSYWSLSLLTEIAVRSRAHEIQEDWKPSFLSNEEFTHLILEVCILFSEELLCMEGFGSQFWNLSHYWLTLTRIVSWLCIIATCYSYWLAMIVGLLPCLLKIFSSGTCDREVLANQSCKGNIWLHGICVLLITYLLST